jgi:L-lactate dehydrogenase
MPDRYPYPALLACAEALLIRAGLDAAMARTVAEVLLEGDLLGKTTHGLHLLGPYLQSITDGKMTLTGSPHVVNESPAVLVLDGKYLPGPVLVRDAIARAVPKARALGLAAVSIRRSHHIGCLQAYLSSVTELGLVIILSCTDPNNATVAPHGGLTAVSSPNPLAAGNPTKGDPNLIDFSTANASNGYNARLHQEGRRHTSTCLQTAEGQLTDDPAQLYAQPPGSILPLGGLAFGYKGFGLSILMEALTSALAGHGRADHPDQWGASVFLQIFDPAHFGGLAAFQRETQFFADVCHDAKPRQQQQAVRLPGENALAARREQLTQGVTLYPTIPTELKKWAQKFGVEFPQTA